MTNESNGDGSRYEDGTFTSSWNSPSAVITITKEDLRSVPEESLRPPSRIIRVTPTETPRASGKAIASLFFGIVGLPVMGILLGPFAIVFGGWALSEIDRSTHLTGRPLALTGMTLGIVDTLVWIGLLMIFLIYGRR